MKFDEYKSVSVVPNKKGRSEGEERTFDCTFWLNKPGGLR